MPSENAKKYVPKVLPKDADPADHVVEAKEVDKNTTIKSKEYGEILVTAGNFVLTNPDGSQVGITPTDLDLRFKPYKK